MRIPNPDRIIVATRRSRLALTQTNIVVSALKAVHPGLSIELREVTTTGDKDQRPFAQIGGKGLFTSEVEGALLDGRADLAVHSAKDLTATLAPGCTILCVPARASRGDVVVGGGDGDGEGRIRGLAAGSSVGTSSMRRRALLAELRDDLEAVELRGNLDTRLEKVRTGVVDVAVLAAAGLERLGSDAGVGALDPAWWVHAPGQGALAVEGLDNRDDLRRLLEPIADDASTLELTAERAFSGGLEGGCSVPLGCSAIVAGDRISITGFLASHDGRSIREHLAGPAADAAALGAELAEAVLAQGGDRILEDIETQATPEVDEP